jgi:signal transduction histidine kinase
MKSISQILSFHNLRTNIIVTFCAVAIFLVLFTARLSYVFISELYLNQLKDHVTLFSKSISSQIENRYLNTLSFGKLSQSSLSYFQSLLYKNVYDQRVYEAFIFDHEFNIIVHSDVKHELNVQDHRLLLNKTEIDALDIEGAVTSLPFKGNDDQWYMWGFVRLSTNHWLAIRESASRLEKVETFSQYFWIIGATSVVVIILLSIWIAGRIVKPINVLVNFSKSIGAGEFDTPKPGNIKGELNVLSESLHSMRNGLAKHHKEKEQMLAKIAHEIRNPLGGIELLSGLIKEDLLKENKSTEYIDIIQKEVLDLKELITAYLNYSKPLKPNASWCNLDNLFEETKYIFRYKAAEKKVDINVENKIEKVWFDKSHLRNVLVNLISNSYNAVDEKGLISISTKKNNGAVEISVQDNGKGIPVENVNEIFEPFFTTRAEGTGLGLAISKKYCEENNSELIYENLNSSITSFLIRIKNHD